MKYAKREKRKKLDKAKNILAMLLALGIISNTVSTKNKEQRSNTTFNIKYLSITDDKVEYLTDHGVEVARLKSGEYYIKSYTSKEIKNIIVYNNEDFCEYLDNKNPTFKDVLKTLDNNEFINEEFKTWIKSYIEKIELNNPEVNLSVFNYNLSKLSIECVTKEQMSEIGKNVVARFSPKDYKILYLEGLTEKTFEHELSHLFTEAKIYLDEKTIIHKTISLAIPVIGDNKITIKYTLAATVEGLTDLFTASNNDNYNFGYYKDYANEINNALLTVEEDLITILDKGIVYFLDNLYNKGIINAFNYLYNLDEDFYDLINNEKRLTKKL